jgi:hypothetical protein
MKINRILSKNKINKYMNDITNIKNDVSQLQEHAT